MDPAAQTFVQAIVLLLAGLLVLRILVSVPGWIRRDRRPERRAILVVGVGGGGGNAVDRMVDIGIPGVHFVAVNTDAQALRESAAPTKIRIGDAVTHGLGTGGDPNIGRRAAEDDAEQIAKAVAGADLVFVTAGLGGGTGSGAAPMVAAKAKEQGALTIGVATKPFDFEGSHRREIAEEAAARLLAEVDALITVPNDHVSEVIPDDASALEAFQVVDDVLLKAVEGIVELLTAPGLINLDFADVRAVVQDAGPALIGLGRGTGEHRAVEAARQAISSPLLETSITGARGILFQVSGPPDLRLSEVRLAAQEIRQMADPRANVIFGASLRDGTDGGVLITLIATGLDEHRTVQPRAQRPVALRPVDEGRVDVQPVERRPVAMPGPAPVPERAAPLAAAATPTEPADAIESEPPAAANRATVPNHPVSTTVPSFRRPLRAKAKTSAEATPRSRRPAPATDDENLDLPSFLQNQPPPTAKAR